MKPIGGIRALVFLALSTLVAAAAVLAEGSAIGEWEPTVPGTGGLANLEVVANRTAATVRAAGECGAGSCEWGRAVGHPFYETVEGVSEQKAISAVFETAHSTTTLVLVPKPQAKLEVQILTTFKAPDKRFGTYAVQTMKRRAPTPRTLSAADDCVLLDPSKFEARELRGQWWLFTGEGALASFPTRAEALQAVKIASALKFDQRCQIGKPKVLVYYFLSRGNAPQGECPGEDCRPFVPAKLKIAQEGTFFTLTDGRDAIKAFGPDQAAAKATLAMILRHGFTKVCYVGRPDPGLAYFKK